APTAVTGAANQHYDAPSKTLWFRPAGSGSFTLHATADDADAPVDHVTFPDLSSVGGWSGSTGGADSTAPYGSPADYAWSSGADAPGAQTINAATAAGVTGTATVTIAADSTAPTGQSIALVGGP